MKFPSPISTARRQTGILLIECVVYIAVFAVLLGVGTASFYYCWDHTKAVMQATDDITSALRAGERWRADIRGATGKISIETAPDGEVVRIPETAGEIVYRFEAGELCREISATKNSQLLLPKVKTSQMETELRSGVTAWRWELELKERRKETHLPLQFTFEAAQPAKP
jgi:Tfp pilus assembly protein FimT